MSRRMARELVLHMIFANDYTEAPGESLLETRLDEDYYRSLAEEYELYQRPPAINQMDYIRSATKGVIEHLPELDSYIEKYAVGWNVGRISRISKSILRLCMYEMLYMNIPVGASVNEALELAKKYDSEEAASFINGLLGSFVKGELNQ